MSYDSSLLAHAPHVTKAEQQEGYNVDILNHNASEPTAPGQPETPQPVRRPPSPTEEPYARKPQQQHGRRFQFWHTPAGRIALAILAFLVVGAIVGGAVGGTVGRHKSSASAASQGSSGDGDQPESSVAPTQGAATAAPASGPQSPPAAAPTSGQSQGSGGGELGLGARI